VIQFSQTVMYHVIQRASLYISDGKDDHECLMARRH